MSEFKGTKGEWVFNPFSEDSNGYISIDIPMGSITVYNGYHPLNMEDNRDEIVSIQEANAKLISCAPEMLEMLIKINSHIDEGRGVNYMMELMGRKFYTEVEQLIKKATE